jgi:FkbH-like protein
MSTAAIGLKDLLRERKPEFWRELRVHTEQAQSFEDLLPLSTLRKRAHKDGMQPSGQIPIKLAIVGGCSLFPLHDLVEHFLACGGDISFETKLFLGDYDNYVAEILERDSALYEFQPDLIFLVPAYRRCRYPGPLSDPADRQLAHARQQAQELLDLCRQAHEGSRAEVLLSNFPLPARFDPGPYRTRTGGSLWTFTKQVNLELGLHAPRFVHLCDAEFISARRGTLASIDEKRWFESKQPGSPNFLLDLAREAAHQVRALRAGPKKVCVLDLDNTLWGGVVGDDGLEGIEIGDTNARGEAFKAFQQYLKTLGERGILLAVSSKNDYDKAVEPFEKHPEMALRREDFVAFRANWRPKSDNIREMSSDLNLGLDSFVFIDDNPAEVEIVRQYAPEVTCILLGDDPALYASQVQDARLFEPRSITAEDTERAEQYKQEAHRQELQSNFTDMGAYLDSLQMTGTIRSFTPVDVPRIAQLISRSNQFNLTTRRRTEAEVTEVMQAPDHCAFTIRLQDRFGDYGLIAIVIGRVQQSVLHVDTWLMSCRVLKRQVEEETVNEIVRLARARGCATVRGLYLPTKKNGMVRDLYPTMGFSIVYDGDDRREFELDVANYETKPSKIQITH